MIASRPRLRPHQGGFAMITALWLTVIAVMLVTAYTTLIQSWVGAVANEKYEMTASSAAMSGVQHALAELIRDTPSLVTAADKGVILTEVLFHGKKYSSDTLMISKVYMGDFTTLANDNEYVELFNPTANTVNLNGLNIVRAAATNMCGLTGTIAPYSYRLIGGRFYDSGVFDAAAFGGVNGDTDQGYSVGGQNINANSNVYLRYGIASTGLTLDTVGWGTSTLFDGAVLGALAANQAFVRKTDALTGLPQNTHNNANDFTLLTIADDTHPRNSNTAAIVPNLSSKSDRKYEFIEIQNTDSITHDLGAENYWIQVGQTTGLTTKRYIHAFPSNSATYDTLAPYDVALVVAVDADTPYIAALSGKTTGDIRWLGLGISAGTSIDTFLPGPTNGRTLSDRGDSIVIGYGGVATKFWSGFNLNDNGSSKDTSWQKLSPFIQDDTTDPYSVFNTSNWETAAATPGVGFDSPASGIDGAADTWYRMARDSFVQVMPDIYYRVRVYDEAGKCNVNTCPTVASIGYKNVLNLITYADQPQPPFSNVSSYLGAQRTAFMDALRTTWQPASSTSASLLTPESPFLIINSTLTQKMVPYMTVYGYAEASAELININTAESPALRAGMITALDGAATAAEAAAIADKIHMYLTNPSSPTTFDTNLYNDQQFSSLSQVATQTNGLTATERGYISNNIADMQLVFRVKSSGYFTIQSTGFLFKKNANPITDTPVARAQVIAVCRREANKRRGEVIFWREIFEDDKTFFPVTPTSRRFPYHPWDPTYD